MAVGDQAPREALRAERPRDAKVLTAARNVMVDVAAAVVSGGTNRFDSTKFTDRFPEFEVTSYRAGLGIIRREADAAGWRNSTLVEQGYRTNDSQVTDSASPDTRSFSGSAKTNRPQHVAITSPAAGQRWTSPARRRPPCCWLLKLIEMCPLPGSSCRGRSFQRRKYEGFVTDPSAVWLFRQKQGMRWIPLPPPVAGQHRAAGSRSLGRA